MLKNSKMEEFIGKQAVTGKENYLRDGKGIDI
jgi:hypothetical protein